MAKDEMIRRALLLCRVSNVLTIIGVVSTVGIVLVDLFNPLPDLVWIVHLVWIFFLWIVTVLLRSSAEVKFEQARSLAQIEEHEDFMRRHGDFMRQQDADRS